MLVQVTWQSRSTTMTRVVDRGIMDDQLQAIRLQRTGQDRAPTSQRRRRNTVSGFHKLTTAHRTRIVSLTIAAQIIEQGLVCAGGPRLCRHSKCPRSINCARVNSQRPDSLLTNGLPKARVRRRIRHRPLGSCRSDVRHRAKTT